MSIKVSGVIQARASSRRFPGKVLAPLVAGRSVLEVLLTRLRACEIEWWIATSKSREDDDIELLGKRLGFRVFRGPEHNVLERFIGILGNIDADWIFRVTADNPFTSGKFLLTMMDALSSVAASSNLVVGRTSGPGYPLGFSPELVRTSAIWSIYEQRDCLAQHHFSHITSAVLDEARHRIEPPPKLARENWRWTVDYPLDFQMAHLAFELFGFDWPTISYEGMVNLLDSRPDIANLNHRVRQRHLEEG